MSAMRRLLLLSATIFPYTVLIAMWLIFSSSKIMDTVFQGNAWLLIGVVCLFLVAAFSLCIVDFLMCVFKPLNTVSLAKSVLTVKLLQIPAYLAIFVLGALSMITIFTIPFTIAFVFIDIATIIMTGMMGNASVIVAFRENKLSKCEATVFSVLQYIFCVDVVASIVLFAKLKVDSNKIYQ